MQTHFRIIIISLVASCFYEVSFAAQRGWDDEKAIPAEKFERFERFLGDYVIKTYKKIAAKRSYFEGLNVKKGDISELSRLVDRLEATIPEREEREERRLYDRELLLLLLSARGMHVDTLLDYDRGTDAALEQTKLLELCTELRERCPRHLVSDLDSKVSQKFKNCDDPVPFIGLPDHPGNLPPELVFRELKATIAKAHQALKSNPISEAEKNLNERMDCVIYACTKFTDKHFLGRKVTKIAGPSHTSEE